MKLHGTMQINTQGHLEIGGCDVTWLARRFGTPLYILDEEYLRSQCRSYRKELDRLYPDSLAIFASKALMTGAICKIIQSEGMGLDVVSGGELYTAARADFPLDKVFFHGNNKSPEELKMALEYGVGQIVVDNLGELNSLNRLAMAKGAKARILLRITPGIDAHTHSYTQTGQQDSKFGLGIAAGVAEAAVRHCLTLPGVELVGLHCHIGSQIFDIEPFGLAVKVMFDLLAKLREDTGFIAKVLDMGGGLGVFYHEGDDPPAVACCVAKIAGAVKECCALHNYPLPRLILEPGRSIVGEAGTTIYTVGVIKEIPGVRTYLAVDGGMADNPRVALYQAEYEAVIANKAGQTPGRLVTVAGKCCESGDILIRDIRLANPEPGDILAVFTTGAYNYSMASNYNRLPRPAMVLAHKGSADIIVARETYEDLISLDRIPERLQKGACVPA
ncbi:MAG: diaminopimelate decarboxylase [Firmicutes bacterium]|nr:diaminopimelate decarboxylase [Bacillota bacterium]